MNRRIGIGVLISLGVGSLHSAARAAPRAGPPGLADFPNVELINQDGRRLRFYDDLVRGNRSVVIGFIYAQCGDICPMTMANLARVQALLGNRLGREVHLLSLSIDPVKDTPAILKGYAERFDARPGWQFLTGRPGDMDAIRRALGAYDRDPIVDRDKTQHTGMLVYGNQARGRWARISALADPRQILSSVTRWT
jgi:protein SCO1